MDSAGGLIMSEHLIRIQLSANPRYCLKAHTHARWVHKDSRWRGRKKADCCQLWRWEWQNYGKQI